MAGMRIWRLAKVPSTAEPVATMQRALGNTWMRWTWSRRCHGEAMQAYQECISQRMQMAAEDGRRLSEDCQKIMQKITTSLTNGSPAGSS
jgi:hypothetical protein